MRIFLKLAAGLALAGFVALPATPASALDWCGFHQKAHSRVHCGYSSLQVCKAKLSDKKADDKKSGGKTVICMPDPANG